MRVSTRHECGRDGHDGRDGNEAYQNNNKSNVEPITELALCNREL